MQTREVRKIINNIWRNFPESGQHTTHECATPRCTNGARDKFCVSCIIATFQGSKVLLAELARMVEQYRDLEARLVGLTATEDVARRKSLKQTLMCRDGLSEEAAEAAIAECRQDLFERLERGTMAGDILEEHFGLEPDWLDELI